MSWQLSGKSFMFKLEPKCVPSWPKLAWVAVVENGSARVEVYHGPMVEVADDWVAEAVWAGDFAAGDFDQTDLVFGSGVRVRQETLCFVSPGSTLDRLCYCEKDSLWHVSNSLPALLASAGLRLRHDWEGYVPVLKTICGGLQAYRRTLPTDGTDVRIVYFNNLVFENGGLREVEKPDTAPPFTAFDAYHAYLLNVADALAANMRSPKRTYPVSPLTTISTGYDSPAVTVLARRAGCSRAVTIRQSTSLWRGSDSGEDIAKCLAIECSVYPRTSKAYPHEETIWAVAANPGVLNWTLLEYGEPLCLFFTGCHGDKVWDRSRATLRDPYEIASVADLGIGEFRLFRGVFHVPVPHWGMRHIEELRNISFSEAMVPWTLHSSYDRPIPRRIAEEAGVPRKAFGVRKKNTSHEAPFHWPYSPEAQESFRRYLRERGVYAPSRWEVAFLRTFSKASNMLYQNTLGPLGIRAWYRPWLKFKARDLIFQWANSVVKEEYAEGLRNAQAGPKEPSRTGR